jgi:hypothetical protein
MRYDDPDAPVVAFVAFLGAAGLLVVVLLLQSYFYFSAAREAERKTLVVTPGELSRDRAAQLEQLASYRVLDAARGVVAIPVEQAMAQVVRESAGRP